MSSRVVQKWLFQIQRILAFSCWTLELWCKNANWFVMLLLVILSIIPKLPLFLFWNPNFTQISTQRKKIPSWSRRRISLHFMLPPHQLQEAQKKNPTMPVVVVLLSFPFLQILTNQPQNRQRRTCKKNYWQKNK